MSGLVPSCVWRVSAQLLVALDERFASPTDAYVNGSQVWLREDGPGNATIEWRLHPVAGYRRPKGMGTDEVFDRVSFALATGSDPPAAYEHLWEGLEAFPAFDDEVEPAELASACAAAIGVAPDAFGLVDHESIGDRWEEAGGDLSVVACLLVQLES